ncbi:MAG: uroporphyrinogen decarboxylase family protein [Armatimonadota bacterium]
MSFADGWAAINLEMPARVPRTEIAAESHWELVKAVTGIDVSIDSPNDVKSSAGKELVKAWNYDFIWSVAIGSDALAEKHTSMGHGVFAAGGEDFNNNVYCPFSSVNEALAFDPWETYGERDHATLVKKFEDHYKSNCNAFPECVNMTGTYVTLVSGLIDIFGWDMLLMAVGTDPDGFGEVANRYASWIQQYFNALADSNVPVVMVHDDIVWTSGAVFRPEWYRKYVFPNYKKMFAPVLESGKKLLYTTDGNYNEFVDDIAGCGVHGFFMEPLTDMKMVAEKYGKTHVIIGNADTRILLRGRKDEIRAEVERCMAIGKGCPGYFMTVGNNIPPNTPVDAALYYNDVYEELSRR